MNSDIGVCSWSVDRNDPVRAIEIIGKELELRTVQIGYFAEATLRAATVATLQKAAAEANVVIHSTFAAFEREDYTSIATIAATGGYMSDVEYPHRLEMTRRLADLTAALGCKSLAVHIGTIPSQRDGAEYDKLLCRSREVAVLLDTRGLELWIEAGRESAEALITFIQQLAAPNVRINFDPGNFVVYGTDDPPQIVAPVLPYLGGVHMKDGLKSTCPGVAYGKPAVLGAGDAQIPRVVSKLRALGFHGPLFLEMSGREDHCAALCSAAAYLKSLC